MALRRVVVLIAVCSIALFGTATASGAANPHGSSNTCSGGPIAPGTYHSLTVTGICLLGPGTYDINGGLTIAPNAGLNATNCDAHVTVSGGIQVSSGALLGLGGSVNGTGCAADTNDVVHGGLRATQALSVIVHGTTINGGFSVQGGGGWTDCLTNVPGLPFPPFTDIEDSSINGGASISGLTTCWMGFIRVHVNGGVSVNNNEMGDPDAIEIGLNVIHGGLACSGNFEDPNSTTPGPGGVPTNSFDGSPPNPNTVTGQETGQCAGL